MNFSDFKIDERLLKGLSEAGYSSPTPIQAATLQHLGQDIYAQSQTGSGKTTAFLIPTLQRLLEQEDSLALIIVPTRELTEQIEKEAKLIGKYLKIPSISIYGGVSYDKQLNAINNGARLIIATPGRLIDFIRQGELDTAKVDVIVLDEADRLFDMGFVKDIKFIYGQLKSAEQRLNMLYSATLSAEVGNLALTHTNKPVDIIIKSEEVTVDSVTQGLYHVNKREKLNLLIALLNLEQPKSTLIFSNTQHGVSFIHERLNRQGFRSAVIAGNVPQQKRLKIVDDFKKGKVSYLIATDVAARGLHIDDLSLVINYDLPDEAENYVHRIGRTARAGASGKALSFACDQYIYNLPAIERYIGQKIAVYPLDAAINEQLAKDKLKARAAALPQAKVKANNSPPKKLGSKPHKPKPSQPRPPAAKNTNNKPKRPQTLPPVKPAAKVMPAAATPVTHNNRYKVNVKEFTASQPKGLRAKLKAFFKKK